MVSERVPQLRGDVAGTGARRALTLLGGVMALSSASILIRLADAPPLVVGAWRMLLATLLLAPWAWPRVRREWPALPAGDRLRVILAGLALAAHFALWITSLSLTTVASSVILVTSTPIYVGLVSHFVLGERISHRLAGAIVVSMVGSIIIGYGNLRISEQALWGDLLAIGGALATTAYLLLGRAVRARLSTLAYVWPCYGVAALALALLCAAGGQPLGGYAADTYLILLLLALGPQVIGHSVFNWALGHVSPVLVTLAILGEPIGASLLAFLLLAETPPMTVYLGGALILGGIAIAAREQQPAATSRDGPSIQPSQTGSATS